MFAVFADTWGGEEVNGCGGTPQMAWENMLTDFAIEEEDIAVDTVKFFVETEVFRETKVSWSAVSDTDDE